MAPAWVVAVVAFGGTFAFGIFLGLVAREARMSRALDDISINDQPEGDPLP